MLFFIKKNTCKQFVTTTLRAMGRLVATIAPAGARGRTMITATRTTSGLPRLTAVTITITTSIQVRLTRIITMPRTPFLLAVSWRMIEKQIKKFRQPFYLKGFLFA